jgi:hypothetical protein
LSAELAKSETTQDPGLDGVALGRPHSCPRFPIARRAGFSQERDVERVRLAARDRAEVRETASLVEPMNTVSSSYLAVVVVSVAST